jgi:multimeric flavodoxin WrbA
MTLAFYLNPRCFYRDDRFVMDVKVLGISTSPRIKGNSDLLLRHALAGAESAGSQAEYVRLADYKIGPCIECNACYETGRCVVQDDYPQLLQKMLDADRLIFATPVFFMTVCAQAKMLIDRGQCLWAEKYILKKESFASGRDRRIRLTMASYFDSLQVRYVSNLFVSKVDSRGEIEQHPSAPKEAYRLGSQLVACDIPLPEKPVTIELA